MVSLNIVFGIIMLLSGLAYFFSVLWIFVADNNHDVADNLNHDTVIGILFASIFGFAFSGFGLLITSTP